MLNLRLLLVVLTCWRLDVRSADTERPDTPHPYESVPNDHLPMKVPRAEIQEPLGRSGTRVKTVSVICYPAYMEVWVKADFFELGMPVDPADLRLGAGGQSCGVTSNSDEGYILQSFLTDCDTRHWVTEEALIYTNLLVYSPASSAERLVRTESAVVPVECHYRRKFNVDSDPVLPTWIPHQTTKSVQETLHFSLRLMTRDWQVERGSAIYFLGEMINIEAAVFTPRLDLQVFFDRCVATTAPDSESVPRYEFIDNGCLLDSQLTHSSSWFLPRERPDKLQLQLKAFIFHQVQPTRIFISCTLKAYPLEHASKSMSKACSFIDGRWRSAEGDDWTCSSCQKWLSVQSDQPRWGQAIPTYRAKPRTTESPDSPRNAIPFGPAVLAKPRKGVSTRTLHEPAAAWKDPGGFPKRGSGSLALEQMTSVGPLSVLSWRNKLGVMAPSSSKEGGPPFPSSRGKRPIPHHSLWRSEAHQAGLQNEVMREEKSEDKDVWKKQHSAAEAVSSSISPTVLSPLDISPTMHASVQPSSSLELNMTQSMSEVAFSMDNPGSLWKGVA